MNKFVAFSGGKDSTALALLCPDAMPIFADTHWEFNELYNHIDRFEEVTGREIVRIGYDLPKYIRERRFLPSHGARFCTRIAKIEPMNKFIKNHLPAELMIGLRADEPSDQRVGNLSEIPDLKISYPLREMGYTIIDVINVCIKNNLLPRYPIYMARGGCKGCFYKRKSEVRAMDVLVPDILDELQKLEEDIQDERGSFFHMFPNVRMSISGIRSQQYMFSQNEMEKVYQDAQNRSDYGINCGLFCHR